MNSWWKTLFRRRGRQVRAEPLIRIINILWDCQCLGGRRCRGHFTTRTVVRIFVLRPELCDTTFTFVPKCDTKPITIPVNCCVPRPIGGSMPNKPRRRLNEKVLNIIIVDYTTTRRGRRLMSIRIQPPMAVTNNKQLNRPSIQYAWKLGLVKL